MSKKAPFIMVSSTFYDLRQIRADLTQFISNELGYTPLLSELNSFPIDPDVDTIDNCRRRVDNEADIMVLVIGGRYGSIDRHSSKSVTNIEYLTARNKGIPIFVFVLKSVIALLPVWKSNPDGDFSSSVDDVRLFQFIENIRSQDRSWIFEFELASDIISTLRIQFAYLMNDGLEWQRKINMNTPFEMKGLSADSIRIALEHPVAWEYRLFAHSLIDHIEALRDSRKELDLGIALGESEYIPFDQLQDWMHVRFSEMIHNAQALDVLVNKTVQDAFGPPGTPGNANDIVFVAHKIATAYGKAIDWSLRIRRATFEEVFEPMRKEMVHLVGDIILKVGDFGTTMLKKLEDALNSPNEDKPKQLTFTLTFNIPNYDKFDSIMKACYADYHRRLISNSS